MKPETTSVTITTRMAFDHAAHSDKTYVKLKVIINAKENNIVN